MPQWKTACIACVVIVASFFAVASRRTRLLSAAACKTRPLLLDSCPHLPVNLADFYDERVELEFWERWLEARGGEWAEEYLLRTTRHPISPDIHPLAGEAPSGDLSSRRVLRVLDVGPGPLTHLGTEWEGGRLEVRLMDPASEAYARLLAKHGIDPPYPRDQVPMTRISQHYRAMPMSFDVIVLHNSLRKSPDPLRTVLQCASLLTPGGHVICGHDPTKALWHLENIKGSAILTYTNSWVNITDALQHFADVDIEASEQWVSLRIVRRDHS